MVHKLFKDPAGHLDTRGDTISLGHGIDRPRDLTRQVLGNAIRRVSRTERAALDQRLLDSGQPIDQRRTNQVLIQTGPKIVRHDCSLT